MRNRAIVGIAITVLVAGLLGAAFLAPAQINDWLFRGSLLIMLSLSWSLMASAGLISLGHSAFWGVGSYAAIMTANSAGFRLLPAVAVAVIAGAIVGAGLALATGRLKGIFFAISTLALSEGLRVITVMLPRVTGGAMGLYLKPAMRGERSTLFVVCSLLVVASIVIAVVLSRTSFQYACRAMRNNESAAQMLGLDPLRYRVAILAISSGIAAAAGAMSAWYGGYLDPEVGFDLHITIESQIAPILGGMYSVPGAIMGAIVVQTLSEATRIGLGAQEGVSQLAFGVILVLGIIFMPTGLYGAWEKIWNRRREFEDDIQAGAIP